MKLNTEKAQQFLVSNGIEPGKDYSIHSECVRVRTVSGQTHFFSVVDACIVGTITGTMERVSKSISTKDIKELSIVDRPDIKEKMNKLDGTLG
ncbi:hypothetical protein [Bacillus toyonensis]|uniref:hypothetical protein n=1 Tax=Bacillus toyonensis TaxID=155322 RepID=UPI000BF61AFC|nr:hypothetical protein [Bacillus toyonensis]PGF05329.1 hypothetical protein COM61_02650 [Bacillus toyonensis]